MGYASKREDESNRYEESLFGKFSQEEQRLGAIRISGRGMSQEDFEAANMRFTKIQTRLSEIKECFEDHYTDPNVNLVLDNEKKKTIISRLTRENETLKQELGEKSLKCGQLDQENARLVRENIRLQDNSTKCKAERKDIARREKDISRKLRNRP